MSKVRTLFVIDVIIATAFLVAEASAVAFLVPFSAIEFATASVTPRSWASAMACGTPCTCTPAS